MALNFCDFSGESVMASLKDIKNGLFPNKEQQVPVDPFVKVMAEREAKETEQKILKEQGI